MSRPSDGKKLIGYSHAEFYTGNFERKTFLNLQAQKELARTWKFLVEPSAAIYLIFGFCRFPDTSGWLRNTKSGSGNAEKITAGGQKRIRRISQQVQIL